MVGAKNVQNLAQFQTALDFDCEYIQNGWRYPKLGRRDRQRFLLRLAKKNKSELNGPLTKKL